MPWQADANIGGCSNLDLSYLDILLASRSVRNELSSDSEEAF